MAAGGAGGPSGCRRQKRMGPAPFASFEDLSDEAEPSPGPDGPATRLPDIHEHSHTPSGANLSTFEDCASSNNNLGTNLAPVAPRIDISRASSSSQHEDSRDSTPERELFQGAPTRLGLAFREEGAMDLRSSTEELDFHDPHDVTVRRGSPAASVTVTTANSVGEVPLHHRKDSQGSEYGGLLSISGRTSRLSSVGSQGSRVSGASHLSVTSGMSRSPSPHKMLLETSFCGSKTGTAQSAGAAATSNAAKLVETDLLERVLLSRKHDPTEAILAEGISIECRRKIQPADTLVQLSPVLQHAALQQPAQTPSPVPPPIQLAPVPPEKPARKTLPLKLPTDVIITVDKPSEDKETLSNDSLAAELLPGGKIVADSGIEYIFIPLKGPLPKDVETKPTKMSKNAPGAKSASASSKLNVAKVNSVPVRSSANVSASDPQYIRIKLKPDHMYPEEPYQGHTKPSSLDLSNGSAPPAIGRSSLQNNSTPSPSVSRKSSFASLFRAKEYGTSPESPTVPASAARRKASRSRSKSSDRVRSSEAPEKPTKHRSVFTLFKSKKSYSKSKQSLAAETSPCRQTATSLHSLEFTFDRPPAPPTKKYYEVPLDGDSIIIPLHTPGSEPPPPLPLYCGSPDVLDTSNISPDTSNAVITATSKVVPNVDRVSPSASRDSSKALKNVAPPQIPNVVDSNAVSRSNVRQSSTSSENVVFSTNLGSDNEVFTTKLPKRQAAPTAPAKREHALQNGVSADRDVELRAVEQQEEEVKEGDGEVDVDTSERAGEIDSSESENENLIKSGKKRGEAREAGEEDEESSSEHERKGLVLQQDSFEDELPYVPTTLPLERSVAVPIVPVKQRAAYEIRTCPIERPRSTTPINPSCLEDYCEDVAPAATAEKLRISLPRDDSISGANAKSGSAKSPRKWTEFVPRQQEAPAPPLPPRGAPRDWINFEEIPERRKPPKRIQTIPSRGTLQPTLNADEANVIYSYVNPEDCKCECHETAARQNPAQATPSAPAPPPASVSQTAPAASSLADEEDEQPLLCGDRRSDSSPESQGGVPPPPVKRAGRSTKSTNAFPPQVSKTSS